MSRLLRQRRFLWLLAATLLVLLSVAGYFSGRRYLAAAEWVTHTFEVTDAINQVISEIQDIENGQRGYLLSGDEAFLTPYLDARTNLPNSLRHLEDLLWDNARQRAYLGVLVRVVEQKGEFAEQTVASRRDGGDYVAMVQTGRGRQLMLDIRRITGAMLEEEKRLLKERTEQAAGAQRRTVVLSIVGIALTLGLALFSLATVHSDLRELRSLSEELATAEKMFRDLAENASELVILVGAEGKVTYVSPSCERLLGYTPDEFLAFDQEKIVERTDLEAARAWILRLIEDNESTGTMNLRYHCKSGDFRWFEVHANILRQSAAGPSVLFSARDVHERLLAQEQIEQKADELETLSATDELTGLLNRRGFTERGQRSFAAARAVRRPLAVVFLDLDGLKPINDQLGHDAGDRALSEAARVLRQTCRGGDLVARLGGDEFAVLAHDMTTEGFGRFRERVEGALRTLNASPERSFRLAFSLGVAFLDPDMDGALDDLVKRADAEMYEEKRARKARRA